MSKFVSERPRRILQVLDLPQIAEIRSATGDPCTLSVFKGLPIIIHPSQAHIRLGVKKEVLDLYRKQLQEYGFDGNIDNCIHVTKVNQQAVETFWFVTHKDHHEEIKKLVPKYEDSLEAIVLEKIMDETLQGNYVSGRYWRADILAHVFAGSTGERLNGYHGSYEEALLRELSVTSPLLPVVGLSRLHNKKSSAVQLSYLKHMDSELLAEHYAFVEENEYSKSDRVEEFFKEMKRQKEYIRKPEIVEEDQELVLVKGKTKKAKVIPAPPLIIEANDPSLPVSHARFIMNNLNLPVIFRRVHPEHGIFTLSLFCGLVVLIYPTGIHIRFFVRPCQYVEQMSELREAGLDEDAVLVKWLSKKNGTCTDINSWWTALGTARQADIIKIFKESDLDPGDVKVHLQGGRTETWVNGTYWRADVIPHLLWGAPGSRIPRYRGSKEETFLNEQRSKAPLARIFNVVSVLRVAETRAREYHKERRLSDIQAISELPAKQLQPEINVLKFREQFIVAQEPDIPLPGLDTLSRLPLVIVGESLRAQFERADRYRVALEENKSRIIYLDSLIEQRDLELTEERKISRESQSKVFELLSEQKSQAIVSVSQRAGVIGEEQAGPLINQAAGLQYGLMIRNAGDKFHCADFIHESLIYGFMLHEVKNWITTVSSEKGIDKLYEDIDICEKKLGRPCFGAILYSLKSNIMKCGTGQMIGFMAPNGHTKIVCVNNIREQVRQGRLEKDIFNDAILMITEYIQQILRSFFTMATHIKENMVLLRLFAQQYLSMSDPQTIIDIFLLSTDIKSFVQIVMTPLEAAKDLPKRLVKGKGSRCGSVTSEKSVGFDLPVPEENIREDTDTIEEEPSDPISHVVEELKGKFETTQDGVSGLRLIASKTEAGKVIQAAIIDGRPQVLERGLQIPSIPTAWHEIFDVSKPWGEVKLRVCDAVMKLCVLDPSTAIKREDLIDLIVESSEDCVEGVKRALNEILISSKFKRKRILFGINWAETSPEE